VQSAAAPLSGFVVNNGANLLGAVQLGVNQTGGTIFHI
jgi:hypothetical protein